MKGYFYKRGNKWAFSVDIGRDPKTGKRRQKRRSGFKTKREAQAACAELHTHATILLQLKENPKVVSERLGHSNIGITLDIYSHVIPDMQQATADRFEQALKLSQSQQK